MKATRLTALRFFALLFLLPGLAGLIASAMISTRYLDAMPKAPVSVEGRVVPREIHGTVVYQTLDENRRLNLIEFSSVGLFVIGLGLGLIYLEKWRNMQPRPSDEEEGKFAQNHG
jgi:hypothetical protein